MHQSEQASVVIFDHKVFFLKASRLLSFEEYLPHAKYAQQFLFGH